MNEENKFSYTYSAPTEEERKVIESIRREYLPKEDTANKIERIQELNRRVKRPAFLFAVVFAVLSVLVFGGGMSLCLQWGNYAVGVGLSLIGIVMGALTAPIYKKILKHNKAKYGKEILALSEEILKN